MDDLRRELEELLAEPLAAVQARERTGFERATEGRTEGRSVPLVLHGAGQLGRRTLAGLRALGLQVQAFSDNSARLQHQEVNGLPVLAPAEIVSRLGPDAVVVVSVWGSGSGHRFERTRAQLTQLGLRTVLPVAALYFAYPEQFLPHYSLDLPSRIIQAAPAVRAGFEALSDAASRAEYVRQLRFRLRLDFEQLAPPAPGPQYFVRSLFSPRADEVYLDCGAFEGDTVASFLELWNQQFGWLYALEPDPATYAKLCEYVATLPAAVRERIQTLPVAAWSSSTTLRFDAGSGLSSAASQHGTVEVAARSIDELTQGRPPTLIKMDIEGAEPQALQGAAESIRRGRPVLAICAYHVQDHLWTIPAYLRALVPDYEIRLCTYGEEGWDIVCYGVPPERATA